MDLIPSGYATPSTDAFGDIAPPEKVLQKLCCEDSMMEMVEATWDMVVDRPLKQVPHIDLLCNHLEATARGEISRLLVNIPPSVGKSTIIAVIWPLWIWTWWPTARFIFFCYDRDLLVRDSLLCKSIFQSDWYQRNWGNSCGPGDKDQQLWFSNSSGGDRQSKLVGKGTGHHPDFIVVDDPQSRDGAKSETERRIVRKWYFETISSRGSTRGAAHVVNQQRLDEDDLSGEIISFIKQHQGKFAADRWHHIMLPMHFDPDRAMVDRGYGGDWRTDEGELLCPSLLDEEAVSTLALSVSQTDPGGAAAQLEQNPTKVSGDMFKINKIIYIPRDSLPEMDEVVRFWDRAATQDGGCFTAGVLLGRRGKQVFILDVARGQWSVDKVYTQMSACAIVDEARFTLEKTRVGIEQEPGSGGKEAAENAQKNLLGHRVEVHSPGTGKESRAQPFAIAMAFDLVYCVADEPWVAPYVEELRKFPSGPYKDQVDGTSGSFQMLFGSKQAKTKTIMAGLDAHQCATEGCERPRAPGSEYCCESCYAISLFNDPTMDCDHSAECNGRDYDMNRRRR